MKPEEIKVVSNSSLNSEQEKDLDKLLSLARKDSFLGDNDEVGDITKHRLVILYGDKEEMVGFLTPKKQSFKGVNHWRAGALFTIPKYRGKGIMFKALESFFKTHQPGISWIDDKNTASVALFKKLGFIKDKEREHDGAIGHWYIRPKIVKALESIPSYLRW